MMVAVCVTSLSMVDTARAEFWFEDFTGHFSITPWTPVDEMFVWMGGLTRRMKR
jgi:hypothetical protein